MPLLANKVYILNKTKKDKKDEETVLFHPLTNEICENDEELARKTFLYNQKIWTCKITGQVNLTYKEAQKSEQGCAKKLKNSFMKCYESTVLQYVHHSRENLENIIHKAWTQIHEEYCVNEPVMIKLTAPKQLHLKGVVIKIDRSAKKQDVDSEVSPSKIASDASSSDKENTKKKIIPIKKNFHYSVKLFEMDKLVNDIPAETIERTLRPPSKDQIRIFIRAHAFRHSGKPTNPWVVNEDLVKKYKLPNIEPEFICDKLKMKEISRMTEIQMYTKLIEDGEKRNDINGSDVMEEGSKKARKSAEGSASKKMKQITLLDMRKDISASARTPIKVKSSIISPSRSIPPLAQQLLRLMKENKNDHVVNQLILKCCQYTDMQISKFPELIRSPIKEKKAKLDLKKKLKNMTPAEKEVFMAERRVELRQLQRERRKLEGKIDDADMVHAGILAAGCPLIVNESLTQDQWARLMSLSEFVRCFKGLLGPASAANNGDLVVDDFCRAVLGITDHDRTVFADLVCLFLKPLMQDAKLRQRKEMGVSLGELPVTACMAGELLRLVLPMTSVEDDINNDEDNNTSHDPEAIVASVDGELSVEARGESLMHNNEIAGPICERLAHCEMNSLTIEEKIAVMELLQGRILELDIISNFIDEYQREATEAYKRRTTDVKDLNDRLKEIRASMSEMSKVISSASVKVEENGGGNHGKMEEDVAVAIAAAEEMPLSARRRMSLEAKMREQEERDKRVDLERQYQRLEREEANCKRAMEGLHQAYNTATYEAKQLMRVQPLGSDRLYRRYWHFRTAPGVIYVEEEVEEAAATVGGECASVSTQWRMHRSMADIAALVASLDERGVRENALKKDIQSVMERLGEEMDVLSKVDETEVIDEDSESFLVRGFKEELRETELNIRQGSLGGVANYGEWDQRLSEATVLGQMKEALTSVFLGVHERFWNVPMKSAVGRNEFMTAVDEAETQSRLNVLQCFLDVCVCWSKSASDDKCRVCHKGHHEEAMLLCDGCNRAYHTFCLRPPLRTVPEGEWLCPRCKPCDRATTDGNDARACKTERSEEQRDDRRHQTELCCVCKTAGDGGLGKCVHCGDLYHAECHEPPLRHMRRTGWYCSSCRREEVANSKARACKTRHNESGTGTELENGDDEEEEDKSDSRQEEAEEEVEVAGGRRMATRVVASKVSTRKPVTRRMNGRVKRKAAAMVEDYEEQEDEEEDDRRSMRPPSKKSRRSARSEDNAESDQEVGDLQSLMSTRTAGRRRDGDQTGRTIKTLIRQMVAHKSAWPFRDPVDEEEVPDYYTIISTPIDLSTIMDRHQHDQYSGHAGPRRFIDDVRQMFINADIYNEPDSEIMSLALDLEQYFVSIYDKCDFGVTYDRQRK